MGEVYNIGGGNEVESIALTRQILRLVGKPETLIQRLKDRPGHDRLCSVEWGKIRERGSAPRHAFVETLASTVTWYRDHDAWWRPLTSGDFRTWGRRAVRRPPRPLRGVSALCRVWALVVDGSTLRCEA